MLLFRVMNEDDIDFFNHLMNLVGWNMTSVDFRICLGDCNLIETIESIYCIGGPDKG